MRAKLGLREAMPDDENFIGETFGFLQQQRPDFTTFFRALSRLSSKVDREKRPKSESDFRDMFIDRAACDSWLKSWRAQLAGRGGHPSGQGKGFLGRGAIVGVSASAL